MKSTTYVLSLACGHKLVRQGSCPPTPPRPGHRIRCAVCKSERTIRSLSRVEVAIDSYSLQVTRR